jgi:hypothetical protein
VLTVGAVKTQAQTFDFARDRQPVVELNGLWRFHPGDDPRWAQPGFDDSQWALLHSDRDWSQQGYKGLSGLAWYRFKVDVPAGSPPLALYVPWLMTSYEVFADGVPIGGFGGMPPHEEADHALPTTLALPQSGAAAHTVTVAIRVWHAPMWASYYGGGPHQPVRIGETTLLQQRAGDDVVNLAWALVDEIVLSILEGVAGLAALGFFYLRPREREYLWFGLMLLFSMANRCWSVWAQYHRVGVYARDDVAALLAGLSALGAIGFYDRLLQGRRDWLFWVTVGATVANVLSAFADGPLLTVKQTQLTAAVFLLPFSVWVLTLLVRAARQGLADARLLLVPVLLLQVSSLAGGLVWMSYLAGWQHKYALGDVALSSWPFFFTLNDLTSALFLLAMLAILIGRFTRTRRHEERYAKELEAAASVQHVLIPEDLLSVPGFAIASVYKPASEVGGDFFQIVPMAEVGVPNGGVLVAVGDVSGKGLQAAMMVSLIVGTLRTLAEQTQQPAKILAGLNRRLYGRSSGGFTTCLVMLVDSVGGLTIATAGHLAPYCNGEELVLENGLPLGLALDAVYDETRFRLEPGDRLTMISDGVLEARSATGELFGFDRTRALSTQDAAYIASAAQEFGQEDDITVLTLALLREPVGRVVESAGLVVEGTL